MRIACIRRRIGASGFCPLVGNPFIYIYIYIYIYIVLRRGRVVWDITRVVIQMVFLIQFLKSYIRFNMCWVLNY